MNNLSISIAFKTLSPVLRLSGQSINNNIINSIDEIVVIKYTVCKRFKCLKNLIDFFNKNLINLGTSIYVQVNRWIPKLQAYTGITLVSGILSFEHPSVLLFFNTLY